LRKTVLWVLGLTALALVLAGCAPNASQDTLNPQGPYARELKNLFVPVFWVATVVFVLVEGGIIFIAFRYRHRKGQPRMPAQTHGNTRLEVGWTILPAVVLAVVAVPTVAMIWELASPPPANAINVEVTGRQWWWKYEYTDPEMKTASGAQIITANQLVIPTGRTIYLTVTADAGEGSRSDENVPGFAVIHSYWVPEISDGKQDAVPGHENHIKLQADHPGTFTGNCAEFCGLNHGIMKLEVTALSPADFEAWVANEKLDAVAPEQGSTAATGLDTFMSVGCIACHAVRGVEGAEADAGPNLTHFGSRDCFAGCILDNQSPEDIARWLRDPAAVKEGAKMPNYQLSDEAIDDLVAYLMSLQ
jgi:cytochrome c oxidase subunit 2